jgi:AcrR family transcriptional regulator
MMNKGRPKVREAPAKARPRDAAREDRRSQRTKLALGRALVDLMMRRDFDRITVQDVLDEARIARATFYSHYRSKDDLLLSDADRFFVLLGQWFEEGDGGPRVAPVAEFFEHVREFEHFQRALERSGHRQVVLELGREHIARLIERRLASRLHGRDAPAMPLPVAARAFAGALMSLLEWWLGRAGAYPAARMDEMFHAMVWRTMGVRAAPGRARMRPLRPTPRHPTHDARG